MGNLVLAGSSNGSTTITPSATGTYTITLPAETGTIQTSGAGFTTNGVAYASSTSALTTGSAITFDGTNLILGSANPNFQGSSSTGSATLINNSGGAYIRVYGGSHATKANYTEFVNASSTTTITSAGNLGLGATPKAWASFTAMEIPNNCFWASYSGDKDSYLGVNLYFDGGSWIYTSTAAASFYRQTTGQHQWFTAPSGTINTAATVTNRMTLDNSGNLLVGTTTAGGKITVSAANGTTPMIGVSNTTSGNASGYGSSLQTAANNTSSYHYYGSTLAVGNWYLYGNGTSSWSSDERLKHNIQTTRDGYLEDVCKLRVVKYQWKNGPQQTELGLIAQEVEQVFPGLVQDDLNQVHPDDPILYKQLKGSVLPMILLKSIQELNTLITAQSATITSLTERITALEGK